LYGSTMRYLFYWSATSSWLIGSSYTTASASVQSAGGPNALCPDQATGWQAAGGATGFLPWPITVTAVAAGPTDVGNALALFCGPQTRTGHARNCLGHSTTGVLRADARRVL
jgi:hypothetical protein